MESSSPDGAADRPSGPWAGVVLAGGGGRRLGGADKAALRTGDESFLERALAALAGAEVTVVVSPPVATTRPVEIVLEDPPGGGPAAGLLAAVDRVADRVGLVVVLAVDMPWVVAGTVERLRAAVGPGVDGAVLDDGRPQHLAAAYRVARLLEVAPAARHGLPVRRLVAPLRLARVPARGRESADVDTPEDLRGL